MGSRDQNRERVAEAELAEPALLEAPVSAGGGLVGAEASWPPAEVTALEATPVAAGSEAGYEAKVSGYGVFAGLWAAFLPVAIVSGVAYPSFIPKYALMLLAAGPGIVPLVRIARRPGTRWPARAALSFLGVALVSALLSSARGIGFFGLYLWGTGFLFWLSCASAFAIGASLRRRDLTWAFYGLLAGAGANAVMAVYQIVFHPAAPAFQAYASGTQADGFLGNPVHLEALLLGAIVLCAAKFCDAPQRWGWFVLLLGVALEFTSERVFIPLLVVVFAVVIYERRARGLLFSAVVSLGCLIGYLGGGAALGNRVTSGTSQTTFGLRIELWRDAARGLFHHPIIGTGPGELLAGTAPYIRAGLGHQLDGRLFTDAHNFLVEVTVTTGILGLGFFVAWLFGIARIARGPFLGFAVALMAVELVEPMNVGVTPLAFLAAGAAIGSVLCSLERGPAPAIMSPLGAARMQASTARASAARLGGLRRRGAALARVVVGVSAAASLFLAVTAFAGVVGFARTATVSLAAARSSNTLVPYWPQSAAQIGFYWRYEYAVDHAPALERADLENARTWYTNAAGRDPADPVAWWEVAQIDRLLGDRAAEGTALARSLADDPYLPASLSSAAALSVSEGKWGTAVSYLHRLQLVRPLTPAERALERTAESHTHLG